MQEKVSRFGYLTSCRLCASDKLNSILEIGDCAPGDLYMNTKKDSLSLAKFPLVVNQCQDCGHTQLSFFVDPAIIYSKYIYRTSDSLGLNEHFRRYQASVSEILGLSNRAKVFDIGCNDGTLLNHFKAAGCETYGIDPSSEALEISLRNGHKVQLGYFDSTSMNKIQSELGEFDLVVANNVLANVENLEEFFNNVTQILQPDGTFIFETGYLEYLANLRVVDNVHHEHIDYFSVKPLTTFLMKFGLRIFNLEILSSKGSSIRVYVTRVDSNRESLVNLSEVIEMESRMGFYDLASFQVLRNEINTELERIHSWIENEKSAGKTVFGYGASVGSTTLIKLFELEDKIDFLADDNFRRHGLFSPGSGIEILDPTAIKNKNHSVVILAWRYMVPIKKRIHSQSEESNLISIWDQSDNPLMANSAFTFGKNGSPQ